MSTRTNNKSISPTQGFTLLELSIVLVIIGLIVGGITVGSSMIRAAELRSIATQFNQYQAAFHTFRDKYLAHPGDMPNATDFWGTAHATPGTCRTTASTDTETCNGDGNGQVQISTGSNEWYRLWQQLANADMIAGSYTGVTGPDHGSYDDLIGINIPEGKIANTGWHMHYYNPTTFTGSAAYFNIDYSTFIYHGIDRDTLAFRAFMTPEEMWSLDKKMDDGKPAQGKVVSMRWNTCTDAIDKDDLDADYAFADKDLRCLPLFVRLFN